MMTTGIKHDQDKPRLELLPPSYWEDVQSYISAELAKWYFYHQYDLPQIIHGFDPVPVMTRAAEAKYGDHNWHKGMRWGWFVGAFHRHVNEYDNAYGLWLPRDMTEPDPEFGLMHGQHANCCLVFLREYEAGAIGKNDCAWSQED